MIKKIIFAMTIALTLIGCNRNPTQLISVADFTVEEVTELETSINKGKCVVVDFGAPWCGPCRKLEPEFKTWAQKHPEAIFVKVNIDKAPQLKRDYKIEYIPHIVVIKGDKMIRLEQNSESNIVEAIKALEK